MAALRRAMKSSRASSRAGVDGPRFVLLKHSFPDLIGALAGVEASFLAPLLEAVVIVDARLVEGGGEVGLGVGAAEKVAAGADFADGVQGLAVFR